MRMRTMAVAVLCLVAAACAGAPPDDAAADRVVPVEMQANRYEPAALAVERDETVTFRFVNRDNVVHDAFVGNEEAQEAHEKEMREPHTDEHDHSIGESAVTVEPGKTEELTYTFEKTGEILIGCHEPGHYAAGMVMKVTVR